MNSSSGSTCNTSTDCLQHPASFQLTKMEALLVLLYSRLPSQASGYKIDESMISRVVAATGMLDSWLLRLQMNIRHLEGYKSHLIEGERAGLWDREISQLAEKLLTEERLILNQVASITRTVSRYLTIFQGRNNLMMADNELINTNSELTRTWGWQRKDGKHRKWQEQ